MKNVTLHTLSTLKRDGKKFAVLTAYDACFAQLVSEAGVEVILVGDSLGMVLQGHDSTLPVTLDEMVYHTRSVANGNKGSMIMSDLPFMTYGTPAQAMASAAALMQAGAHIIKIEGGAWLAESISLLADRGVPVCAHLGLTPQAVNRLGGYRVQGRDRDSAKQMIEDAVRLEQAGASLLLLECVPSLLAGEISRAVDIPVIGIGAGPDTDAQVLVMHDILGISPGRTPRFVKNYMAEADDIRGAIQAYADEVHSGAFPTAKHGFE
ncbi:3-methyl-2-oxobutanoate hydroxymethyltransferase [Marinobacterium nitratireducens]|uniref:3-methyl-2-oxobutanoate hydroxymethyltransferase n=1 Tax=Marinobacterium nitratireducens TaxID=518897 RepID=A0A917ZRK6_9GAMM|nr:3-methyl-2-oxobutanoate hydroxymethyltransferase [Marinobacterium nitratireducens]GGO88587.1 3-methyl-2-oxobutanoate hydroxymethyltransferase [Marinobacterium nitratireducens]